MQHNYATRSGSTVPVTAASRSRWVFSVWLLLCFLASSAAVFGQTVSSDKDDYAPGEIATITGTGWENDQMVHVEFKEEPDYPDTHIYDLAVDENGTWVLKYQIETRHIGVKFTVIAKGQQSGHIAQTIFTDANVNFNASGLTGTPTITVSYRVYTTSSGPSGSSTTRTFTYPGPPTWTVAVTGAQTIEYSFSNVTISNVTYTATGGTWVGNNGNGTTTFTAAYCTSPVNRAVAATATSVCPGSGTNITVASSASGTTYQLRNNANNANIGAAVTGNGGPINLPTGNLNATTTFNVLATSVSGGCTAVMSNTPTVTVQDVTTTPVITAPICAGATSVSGTSTEANGTVITVFRGGVSQGTTTVSGSAWTVTGLTLAANNTITATAQASGKCVSTTSSPVTAGAAPDVSGMTTSASIACEGSTSTVSVKLADNTNYRVTYNLTGANSGTSLTASFTTNGGGNGSFTTPVLDNGGATTVTITSVALQSGGCSSSPTTGNTATITVNPTVSTPTEITVVAGSTEPTCQTTDKTPNTRYNTTATNATSYTWTYTSSPTGAGSLDASKGEMNWNKNYTGTVTISVVANGCNGPSAAVTRVVNITATIGTPVFALGATSTRCQAAGTVTYTAIATNAASINYTLDATSLGAGNTINSATGAVTYVVNWSGNSTITATATGCNGPTTASHTVTINPAPTTANAGPNQPNVVGTSTTLAANTATVGTGSWSIVSSTGTDGVIATPTSPTSTFSGTAGTTYTLLWTISTTSCGSSTSDVSITFNQITTNTATTSPIVTYGSTSVTLSATVTPNPGAGSVDFYINNSKVGTGTVGAGGIATYNYNPSALNVNTYTIKADFLGSGFYTASTTAPSNNGVLTVNRATPTISVSGAQTFTYTGSAQGPATISYNGDGTTSLLYTNVGGAAYSSATAPTAAGNYQVVASATAGTNYSTVSSGAYTFTIGKATSTTKVTIAAGPFTYTGSALTPATVSVTGAGGVSLVSSPVATYNNNTNAGTATASYTFAGDNNHEGSNDSKSFTIGKATATITLAGLTGQVYDGSGKVATATTSPASLSGVTVSYSQNGQSVVSPTNAGTYNVVASLDNANYQATNATGNLVIGKATATLALGNLTHTYDGTLKNATATTTPANLSGVSISNNGKTDAGTYAVVATLTNANYQATEVTEDLVIAKAPTHTVVTITGGPFTYTGSALTPATVKVTGPGGLDLTPAATYANNVNAGTATASFSYAGGDNYLASSDSQEFTIGKADATVVVTVGGPYTYDGTTQGVASAKVRGVGGADLGNATVVYKQNGNTVAAPTNAGSYDVFASFAGNSNYNAASDNSQNLVIGKAASVTAVTITGGPFTYTGSALTPATVSVTGPGGVSLVTAPVASYSNNTNAGVNTASASYTFAGDANHEGSSDSKTFTIGKAASVTAVTITGGPFTYTGSALTPATVKVTGPGGLDLTPAATYANNVNAGTATASFSYAGGDNYLASSSSKTFAIGQAALCVNYNGTLFTNTSSSGSPATLNLSVTLQDNAPSSSKDWKTASVKFYVYKVTSTGETLLTLSGVNATLQSGATASLATFATTYPSEALSLSNLSVTYRVAYTVDGNYSVSKPCSDDNDSQITVSFPTSEFVTGGGFVIPSNTTATGADAGRKNNFGFNMKYNNRMTNLQGNLNTVIKRGGKVFHVKSNSPDAISVTTVSSTSRNANLAYKSVVIQQIVDGVVVWSMGNNTATISVADNSEPGRGTTPDRISIVIRDRNGLVWYSNSIDRATQALGGGNIQVRTATSTTATGRESAAAAQSAETTTAFTVNAYPNPFADKVTLSIGSEVTGDVAITVVDGKGRTVTRQVAQAAAQGAARTVEIDLSGEAHGMYLLNVQSGAKREVIKVFKMNR
jgi:hypothetical protein